MDLILLRHTTPDIAQGVCYGQTDLDVVQTFQYEAETVLKALPSFSRVVTSPLKRCRVLANYVSKPHRLEPVVDERLAEMNFGSWEGRRWADIPRAEVDAWAEDFLHARPHSGETVAELQGRILPALKDWRAPDHKTLIVTHAGVIRAAFATGPNSEDFSMSVDFGGFVTLPATKELKT